ncbi:MAG: glycyl-radical enzyme activating protein [Spirochaetes bacterium]|nr:glycyl-radical enzyme activating protein [Spirochaetota bacterium]
MNSAVITNIQGYSIHDGPGIRTVVFFKGCPLSCEWCANPECISRKPQMGFIESLCKKCGKCLEACPENAIRLNEGEFRIDYLKCTVCGKCEEACVYDAIVRYGGLMTVNEVWDAVRRDRMFYDSSGGGVTVSGGEPLLYAEFVHQLFDFCREEKINTCVETCGFVDPDAILEVIPVSDFFLFDIKHMDSVLHKKYTGQSNNRILENAELLIKHNADVMFRLPLVPGINDSETNIKATSEFLKGLGEKALKLQLMPYHRMGQGKYKALDMVYHMEQIPAMDNEAIETVKNKYMDLGILCTVSR